MIVAAEGSIAAERIGHVDYHLPPGPEVSWPILVGQIPAQASAFQVRPALCDKVDNAQDEPTGVAPTQVLSGGGGVGKSQLAARYARHALTEGADLVVWVDAAQPGAVTDAFAQAARAVRAPAAAGTDAEADARAFLAWAAVTSRTWLVILDDITEPPQLLGWWPQSAARSGRVLATTRRRDAALTGSGRTLIDVDVYTPGEAHAYLSARLGMAGLGWLVDDRAEHLAAELGYLPLALSHAAAYMIDQQVTCAGYLDQYTAGSGRLENLMPASADGDGYGRSVAVTLLLSLDAADACDPAGMARPAIWLAAMFDPGGHPATLWQTSAVTTYLTERRALAAQASTGSSSESAAGPVTAEQARAALLLLHRYSLVAVDGRAGPRAVRVHAMIARAAREAARYGDTSAATRTAADALLEVWPDPDLAAPALADALRCSAMILARREELWYPTMHQVLLRTGRSLGESGQARAAFGFFDQLVLTAREFRGEDCPEALAARHGSARWQGLAGDHPRAAAAFRSLVADTRRLLRPNDPAILAARGNLAHWQGMAGDPDAAASAFGELLADMEPVYGRDHPEWLATRHGHAWWTGVAGDPATAARAFGELLADMEPVYGRDHPECLATRRGHAWWTGVAGDPATAATSLQNIVADARQTLGADHPAILAARGDLAYWQAVTGDHSGATAQLAELIADACRMLGPDHPTALTARVNLAHWQAVAGGRDRAIASLADLAADATQALGANHLVTLACLRILASWKAPAPYQGSAATALRELMASRVPVLGPAHPSRPTEHPMTAVLSERYRGGEELLRLHWASEAFVAGDYTRAIRLAEQVPWSARDADPVLLLAFAHFRLGIERANGGDFDSAITYLKEAREYLKKAAGNWPPDRRTRWLITEQIEAVDQVAGAVFFRRGIEYANANRLDEAIADMEHALRVIYDQKQRRHIKSQLAAVRKGERRASGSA